MTADPLDALRTRIEDYFRTRATDAPMVVSADELAVLWREARLRVHPEPLTRQVYTFEVDDLVVPVIVDE